MKFENWNFHSPINIYFQFIKSLQKMNRSNRDKKIFKTIRVDINLVLVSTTYSQGYTANNSINNTMS